MENREYFFSVKDVKYQLLDGVDVVWKGKMEHYSKGEIDATVEDLTFLNVAHLIVKGRMGNDSSLRITVDNDKFWIWQKEYRAWNDSEMKIVKDLSKEWQERLLEKNGQVYADYLAGVKPQENRL